MTNEEIIKCIHPDFYNKRAHVRRRVLLGFEVEEAMDAARKDEAIAFGEFLFDYDVLDTKIDYLYQHRVSKEAFYPDELYELFKKSND